ncbi:unnamed protein product [Polarella glacialis]|uniref:Uncharacterized protein n=1 Tax=Polarella glacialis TaxID=89957 RepID=A0A813HQH8_POLGL|nr:unnamed protein product [Polarella glacialis]
MEQMQDNKKYEVDADDQSAAVCNAPEAISQISCASSTKCCTSKRSFLAGTAHDKQTQAKLYSICCPVNSHCKFDTIFVSCAPGAGKDDTSGVLAGLVQEATEQESEAQSAKYTRIMEQMQDNKKYEVDADDQSAAVCNAPEAISQISCSTKCCTSKRSFLAGTAHDKQTQAKLYSISCPVNSHCKFDTIFVSCAPGAGKDDTSGVLAGLVQEATEQESEAESAKYTRIMEQMQDSKKYEVDADDQSAAVCNAPEAISQISCASSTKCCTSKRSFLAGTAHDKQTQAKLYSISCPVNSHCKFDTIFVSCAPGAGKDDTSGVLAGLVQEATEQESEAESAKYTRIMEQMQDSKKYEVDADDQSAAVCNAPEAISQISCASSTKCCTSKRSFLAGTAHDKQTQAKLCSICCPVNSHCKFDTIFVSCAPGAGKDDTSGVLAGLVQEATEQESEAQSAQVHTHHGADAGQQEVRGRR